MSCAPSRLSPLRHPTRRCEHGSLGMSRELVLYQEKPEPAPPVEPVPAFWEAPDDEREEPVHLYADR